MDIGMRLQVFSSQAVVLELPHEPHSPKEKWSMCLETFSSKAQDFDSFNDDLFRYETTD